MGQKFAAVTKTLF